MTCTHHLWDEPDAVLICVLPAGHPHGHSYANRTGSDVANAPKEEL